MAALGLMVCLAGLSAAQESRPEITPLEKVVNKRKKGSEPRAVALLQLSSDGKATIIPIAILIDEKFWDASSYKADPVPMALESGTVYEGERNGNSLGLFTVNSALHSTDPNAFNPWIGTGSWLPEGAEPKRKARKAENVPVGLETTDEPPRLAKAGKTKSNAGPDSSSPSADSGNSGSNSGSGNSKTTSGSNSSSGSKPSDASQQSSQSTASPTTPPAKPDANNAPGNTKSDQAAPAPGEDTNSDAGDSGRPKLRRGRPTAPLPGDEDVPGYIKPGAAITATVSSDGAAVPSTKPAQSGVKPPPQLIPAISDSGGPDPHPYVFEWAKSEEEERRKQVLGFAQDQIRAYLQTLAKETIPIKPTAAKSQTGAHRAAARTKTPDFVLEEVQIRTFDLWGNNQPVIVFTAKAHPPLPAVGTSAANPAPEYSVALVARTDIYNNLHKLYAGVTDKFHLDVTPQLELIDAVDADGDGRGELLFRETSDAGKGYIIYRATGDTLWKMFDSLRPE